MSIGEARRYARKARKAAPHDLYDLARAFEQAIEEICAELEDLQAQAAKASKRKVAPGEASRLRHS